MLGGQFADQEQLNFTFPRGKIFDTQTKLQMTPPAKCPKGCRTVV